MYHDYVRDLHALYHSHPALWEWDYNPDGFQWLSTLDAEHCVFTFVRRSEKETLLILLNFSKSNYEQYRTGVLEKGKYKEIFNSDRVCYGGGGRVNSRLKTAKLEAWDGLEYSIRMNLAPYTISVIRYQNENK